MQQYRADSFASWKQLISTAFVPLDARPVNDRPFTGLIDGSQVKDIGFLRVTAQAHQVVRTPTLIDQQDGAFYKLSLQLKGNGMLRQDGREARLSPGELAIYDTQRPYTLEYLDDFSCLVLIFPQRLLSLSPADVGSLTALAMGRGNKLAEAMAPFIMQIAEQLPELHSAIGHRLALNVVDLLSTLLAEEIYSSPDSAANSHPVLLRRIQHHIEAHLADPRLSPQTVAEAHFIATRTLQKIFASAGYTVAGWIRERRLEHSGRDLADPLHNDVPVGAIGARWGYPDAAHFSRVFRANFGCSPGQYRKRALDAAAAAS